MIRRLEGWSVVLAGFWNRAIFLPEWAMPRLFPLHEKPGYAVQTEVALLSALPLIYRDAEVTMEISGGHLAFRPQALNDKCLLRCERMARDMLQTLPETPVHAIGINFSFREAIPPGHVVSMFSNVDDGQLAARGWAIGERKSTRRLTGGDGTLILSVTMGGEAVDFDFNFHSDTTGNNAVPVQAMQEGRILRLRETAYGLLRDTYQLEIEENDGGGGEAGE